MAVYDALGLVEGEAAAEQPPVEMSPVTPAIARTTCEVVPVRNGRWEINGKGQFSTKHSGPLRFCA